MFKYKDKKVFPLNAKGESAVPFTVEVDEEYIITPLGYINPLNPSGDAIYKSNDHEKVEVRALAKLTDGTIVFSAINNCDCGVHIEVFKKTAL